MDVNVIVPADNSPAPQSRDDLAQSFAAELAAERGEPAETPADEPDQEIAETVEAESAPVEAEESEAEDADDTAQAETDDAAETPSVDQSIAAPSGMSDADKALYAKLPAEMKAWVAKQESARTADYTRKTQEVAAQRKQFDTGVANVMQRLEALDQHLAKFTDNEIAPPDPALRNTDPMAYDDQLANYMHAQHLKELAGKERQKVQSEHKAHVDAMRQRFETERTQQLQEMAPELFGENGKKIGTQIQSFALKNGYTTEQLKAASATDIITLWKAQRFDAIEAGKKQVKTVAPPVRKVAAPGPAKAVGRPTQLSNAVNAMNSNPSRASLAAAYAAELASERR